MVCFDCVHCKVCTLYKKYNEPCEHYEERKKKGNRYVTDKNIINYKGGEKE